MTEATTETNGHATRTVGPRRPTAENLVLVPWSHIHVDVRNNTRHDLPKVVELANNIATEGQLTPVVLHPLTDAMCAETGKTYSLGAGYRRHAAWEHLGWQKRPMMAVVRPKAGPVDRAVDNFLENQREKVHPLDAAERVHQLVTGSYPVDEGEEASPVERAVVCQRLMITSSQLKIYLRIVQRVDPQVLREARGYDVPLHVLDEMCRVEVPEGLSPEAAVDHRVAAQSRFLSTFLEKRAALEASGRQRAERSDKKNPSGDASARKAPLALTRKVDPKGRKAADYVEVLERRIPELNKLEGSYASGALDMLRLLTGDITRLKHVTGADFEALEAARADSSDDGEGEA